jgi:prophage tail gpP-like protein
MSTTRTTESRRVTITVRVPVILTLYAARQAGGEVVVTDVQRVSAPTATEVMEALDVDQQFDELDRLYDEAAA